MKTEKCYSIDWIQGTFEFEEGFRPEFYALNDNDKLEPARPLFSYTDAVAHELYTLCWNADRPEMRVLFQMTGKQVSEARHKGYTDIELIARLWRDGLKFTRLDWCCDLFGTGGDVLDVRDAWQTPLLATKARKCTAIESRGALDDKGSTVYLGSRQSTRLVRIYDKGKEQGSSLDWIRVEMEWKQDRAAQLARDMVEHGVSVAGQNHLRDYVTSTRLEWFERVFDENTPRIDITSIGRQLTNSEKWIFEVCLPAIATAVENGLPGVVEVLDAIIQTHGERRDHGPKITIPRPKS